MMKFRTQFTYDKEKEKYFVPTGDKIEMRHEAYMDSNGRRELRRTKKVAIYDLIQSHKEECEIENIIRRAVEGDYSAISASNPIYTDITNCPSSIAEAQQFIINAKENFEKLPKETKAKFEFNPEIYIAEMSNDTESFLDKMGYTEKIKLEKEKAEKAKIAEENFQKAIETIASGTTIIKKEVEPNE